MARGWQWFFKDPPTWAKVAMIGGTLLLVVVFVATVPRPAAPKAEALPPPRIHDVLVIGDSWSFGIGASENAGFASLVADDLDANLELRAVPGSGYTVDGGEAVGESRSTFGERIDRLGIVTTDVVVIQGSLNDRVSDEPTIAAATDAALASLRMHVDEPAPILVLGASYTPGSTREEIDRINRALSGAAQRHGMAFIDPAAANWTDPADPTIWSNENHVNDAGHRRIADQLVPVLTDLFGKASAG